jgi:hypothetical protein
LITADIRKPEKMVAIEPLAFRMPNRFAISSFRYLQHVRNMFFKENSRKLKRFPTQLNRELEIETKKEVPYHEPII